MKPLTRLLLAFVFVAGEALAAGKLPPGEAPPVPGAPNLPKQPPPPDATLYYGQFPSCYDCRVAMAYLSEGFGVRCKRETTELDRKGIAADAKFQEMVLFVQSTDRAAASRQTPYRPGDKRRALALKAKLLMEDYRCK